MKKRSIARAFLALSPLMFTLAACGGGQGGSDANAGTDVNWPNTGGGYDEIGYSRLDTIDTGNVDKLGLAWSMDLDDEVTLEATPLAVDGVIYFTGSTSSVYAVDAKTGKQLWRHDPEVAKNNPLRHSIAFGANRGAAYADGRVFAGALDGRLQALDAKTGKLLWSVQTLPEGTVHTMNGAPRVFNGKVIIGNAGADFNMRGFVTAYDQKTGKQLWRFYTTPGSPEQNKGDAAMEAAAKTWGKGKYWETGTGGTVWNGITFDPDFNRIYIGTGNAGPWNPKLRDPDGGDNLYLASIVALDADTGKYVWHYQYNPREAWDYKATANMLLTTLEIDGKPRKVVMQAPTNGFFYVIDRETGKVISAEKTGKVNWADHIDLKTGRPAEMKNIRYETGDTIIYPSPLGTHNWQAMSYNPKSGLVYIPYMQLGGHFSTKAQGGAMMFGGISYQPHVGEGDGHGALLAWDPVKQKEAWRVPIETIWNGGTLSTGGNLVFQGTGDGYFSAYNAKTGERLWRFNAGLGIVAAPMSFAVDGKQYVAVLVGYGGTTAALSSVLNAGWKYGAQKRRLLVFGLDGKAQLPPSAPRDMKVNALDVPDLVIDEAALQKGQMMSLRCMGCHGPAFRGAGSPAPDLRESQVALDQDAFYSVVHDGALVERGMPKFEDMTKEDVRALYMYLRASSREALGTRKKTEAPRGQLY